jgi:hypothetical protein
MRSLQAYHYMSLVSAVILFLIFIYTGLILENEFVPKTIEMEPVRMMARADHIYIFYVACLNLVLGLWDLNRESRQSSESILLQWASRLLLTASSVFPVISFFTQTRDTLTERTLNLPGLIVLIGSMLCVIFVSFREKQ